MVVRWKDNNAKSPRVSDGIELPFWELIYIGQHLHDKLFSGGNGRW
jgi:hypothetical protein